MVGPFCFVLKSRLAGIAGRNKLPMNMKAHLQGCAFCFALKSRLARIAGGMKDYEGRSSPTCHFERKREIFSVCGQSVYACERKREA